ncbi:aminotransferase class V-fold PLP-dependent enzyme [Shouchella patagoniensis]|uniref:aminotransferase class V-fold PLP-dependent enzyme n=1 Tax=Shouchella patagoniensis TaxID=228576 RepID=UPI0009951826|nr:aminotransferase class V-fold PLP-dependent enzyme [Shouchella patagoniensis]
MLYFDHAATSSPKPKGVIDAVTNALEALSANPGRSGHKLSLQAAEVVFETRKMAAELLGAPSPKHIWFYPNATYALNQAILGFPIRQGGEIVTTVFEHNSVLRPLHHLQTEKDIQVTYASGKTGSETARAVVDSISTSTDLIVINHASNVTGELIPLKDIAEKAKAVHAILLVDASQTAGIIDINLERDGIDMVACPGHKGLQGPQGTGLLAVSKDLGLIPLIHGGTGNQSELTHQPETWPERYEAGTVNTPGIAGLGAGLKALDELGGVAAIYQHEQIITSAFLSGIRELETVKVVGSVDSDTRVAVVAFQLTGVNSQEAGIILDQHYQMAVRSGLHCAPKLHEWFETSDEGLLRVSFGPYTTLEEVNQLVQAIKELVDAFKSN